MSVHICNMDVWASFLAAAAHDCCVCNVWAERAPGQILFSLPVSHFVSRAALPPSGQARARVGSHGLAAYVHHITQRSMRLGSAASHLPIGTHQFIPKQNEIHFCLFPVEKYDVEMGRLRSNR